MTPAHPVALHVASGAGRLCRTSHGVLFAPQPAEGWEEIVAAADSPQAEQQGIAVIADTLASRGLDAPAFVYATWHPRVAVLVFGDVELRTDHPAVPMLSGAGSQTWVEHSVPAADGQVTLFVTPPEDTDTDLTAGTVPAGGFRLQLRTDVAVGIGDVDAAPTGADTTPATPRAGSGSAPPEPEATDGSWRPPTSDLTDPDAALTAIQAAAVTDDPGHTSDPTAVIPPAAPDRAAVRGAAEDGPEPPHAADATPASDPTPDPRGLVEAVACANGHANPPGRGSCRACDALIPPGAELTTMPRPVLGMVELDDGQRVDLDEDVVLGRRPDTSSGGQALLVEGDRISRTHARIVLRGWEVLLHDEGSRNGTFVVSPGTSDLVRVEPKVPVRLEPGTTVYLGTRSLVLHDTTP